MSMSYGIYERRSGVAETRRTTKKRARITAICPFTLEAVKDCINRKKARHAACRYSLEDCLASR